MTAPDYVWFLAAGTLFVAMALAGSVVRRLPLSAAMFYVAAGAGLSAAGMLAVDPVGNAAVVERVAEVAVVVSLFTAGLKLRLPLRDPRWRLPLLLATLSMLLTVAAIAAAGVWGLGLPLGAAVLLGALLAPTDPVLAADVQVTDPADRDRVRFGLTGEAGLNDGTAFPFVMLGLGMLGLHDLGAGGWKWWAFDMAWAAAGGLAVGSLLGAGVARLVLYLRHRHREAVGADDFLALGLIGLAYGAALAVDAYGFLAVFAAGLAVRRVERTTGADIPPADVRAEARAGEVSDAATHPDTAPAFMAEAVLGFNERLERIGEVAAVVLLGALLLSAGIEARYLGFAALVLLVCRPLAVFPLARMTGATGHQAGLIAWFGVRGVGSVYYLAFATTHGLPDDLARLLAGLVLTTVAVSVVAHGVSVTPLMDWYARKRAEQPLQNPTPAVAGSSSPGG